MSLNYFVIPSDPKKMNGIFILMLQVHSYQLRCGSVLFLHYQSEYRVHVHEFIRFKNPRKKNVSSESDTRV